MTLNGNRDYINKNEYLYKRILSLANYMGSIHIFTLSVTDLDRKKGEKIAYVQYTVLIDVSLSVSLV